MRTGILAEPKDEGGPGFTEEERRKLFEGGAVGPGNEVRGFNPHITVGFLLKYVRALGL